MRESDVELTTIYGAYKSGFVHGDDRLALGKLAARGYIFSAQGPEWSNRDSDTVTVLYRDRKDGPAAGWNVWGTTTLHHKSDVEGATAPLDGQGLGR